MMKCFYCGCWTNLTRLGTAMCDPCWDEEDEAIANSPSNI